MCCLVRNISTIRKFCLKEIGDFDGAVQFYLKVVKLKPRLTDALALCPGKTKI